jgi:hypothetical protein
MDTSAARRKTCPLYNDFEWRMQGNSRRLTISSIFIWQWLTIAFCNVAPFFLGRFNRMATDIGSLAPGHDGHALGSGMGNKGITLETPRNCFFLWVHSFFRCRLYSHYTLERHYSLDHSLWTPRQTLLASLISSPLRSSLLWISSIHGKSYT